MSCYKSKNNLKKEKNTYDNKYKENRLVHDIKRQAPFGACWAFAEQEAVNSQHISRYCNKNSIFGALGITLPSRQVKKTENMIWNDQNWKEVVQLVCIKLFSFHVVLLSQNKSKDSKQI